MAFNPEEIRFIEDGETYDASVLNRPITDFIDQMVPELEGIKTGGTYSWAAGTYASGISVVHNGNIWIAKQSTTQEPSDTATHWKKVITTDNGISAVTITTTVPTVTTGTINGHVWYIY